MLSTFAMLIALLAPVSSAELQIEVSPKNARIELDGKAVDGFTDLKVIAGNHKLVVTASGYDTETRTISLKPGTKRTEKVALNKSAASKPPVAKKPVESSPPVAKKPPTTRKPVARKPTTRKPVSKRPPARKPVSKRPPARKPVSKRPPARKPVTTKPVTKRPPKSRPTAGGGARPAAPVRDTRQPSQVSYKPWAILSFVVGAAAVTGGAIMGMKADDSADQFNNSVSRNEKRNLKDDVEFQATAANVLYGVGAAGIVIGALLWSLDPADSYAEVAPMPGGGAYVGWGGTF